MASQVQSSPETAAKIDEIIAFLDNAANADTEEERASRDAVERAKSLVCHLSGWTESIPEPAAMFVKDGGIQIAWRGAEAHVRLFCAKDPNASYIYTSETVDGKTSKSDLTKQIGVFMLVDALKWLQQH